MKVLSYCGGKDERERQRESVTEHVLHQVRGEGRSNKPLSGVASNSYLCVPALFFVM